MDPFKIIDEDQRSMMLHPQAHADRLILYDDDDNDVNRHANRQVNQITHLQSGSSEIKDFVKEEKLRKFHQNQVYQRALSRQIEEQHSRKERDKAREQAERVIEAQKLDRQWKIDVERVKGENDRKRVDRAKMHDKGLLGLTQGEFLDAEGRKRKVEERSMHESMVREKKTLNEERETMLGTLNREIDKEKLVLQRLPGQIQQEIKTAMNNELEIMKQEISKNTKDLESEMMNLRAKAIQ